MWSGLRVVAQRQWGLFTAAQARTAGVAAYRLARAVADDQLYRVRHGVYGFTDTPGDPGWEDTVAAWLALNPATDITARRRRPEAVVSHASAADLRDLGSPAAFVLEWTAPRRINVRDRLVRTRVGSYGIRGRDWDLLDGLPVSTPRRICADLLRVAGDGGDVGSVLAACLAAGHLDRAELDDLAAPHARVWGCPRGDGTATVDALLAATAVPVGA